MKLLAFAPEDRHASARELLDEINSIRAAALPQPADDVTEVSDSFVSSDMRAALEKGEG
jgi:hypothetical protein